TVADQQAREVDPDAREVRVVLDPAPELVLGSRPIAAEESRHFHQDVAGERSPPRGLRIDLEDRLDLATHGAEQADGLHDPVGLSPAPRIDAVPEVSVLVAGRERHRALSRLAS